jgi:hypothetical protein
MPDPSYSFLQPEGDHRFFKRPGDFARISPSGHIVSGAAAVMALTAMSAT